MEEGRTIVNDENGCASLSIPGTCALDIENTSTKITASCKNVKPLKKPANVDVRSTPQPETSDSNSRNKMSDDNSFHEEPNVKLDKDPLKDDIKCLTSQLSSFNMNSDANIPSETTTGSKLPKISPAIHEERVLNAISKENVDFMLPDVLRQHDNISLPPPTDLVNDILHAQNASSEYKIEMHDKSGESTEPVPIDATSNSRITHDIATSSVTSLESTVQSSEPLSLHADSTCNTDKKLECQLSDSSAQHADACLNSREEKQASTSITESNICSKSGDNDKIERSDSDLKDTLTAGSKNIHSPISIGISEIRSASGKAADAPKTYDTNRSMFISKIAHRRGDQYLHRSSVELIPWWSMPTFSDVRKHAWKPKTLLSLPEQRPRYNIIRRRKYVKTSLDSEKLDTLIKFFDKKLQTDEEGENFAINFVDDLLEKILYYISQTTGNKFSSEADEEGSVTVDTKVGKLDELDYSVEILLEDKDEMLLCDEPFQIVYANDDIDAYVMDEIPETAFVDGGKRLFPDESRPLDLEIDPVEVPEGQVAVWLAPSNALRFLECCTTKQIGGDEVWGWILPYQLLRNFHEAIGITLQDLGLEGVTLNNGARGPAVTLTILQQDGPNISVDITPKLNIAAETLNVRDFHWPRTDTRKWLTKSKVKKVCAQTIYLVPKGDKYWKISFANLENELLDNIDEKGTWRKQCLRIMKKKLIQWKSKSRAGLKCLSSYLLKTTLFWMCEILPDDSYWTKEQLANRYLNFLQELEFRLKKRKLGEYFNPSVNLLEYKDVKDIEELREFLQDEIEDYTK